MNRARDEKENIKWGREKTYNRPYYIKSPSPTHRYIKYHGESISLMVFLFYFYSVFHWL